MKWRVKVDKPEYIQLGAALHAMLNKKQPPSLDHVMDLVEQELGNQFFFTRQQVGIAIHPILKGPTNVAIPERIILITQQFTTSKTWYLTHSRCGECCKEHDLFFIGPVAPFIFGYRCPETDKVTISRVTQRWSRSGSKGLRAFAVAIPRLDRCTAAST